MMPEESKYVIWTLNHDGWIKESHLNYDDFYEVFMTALNFANLHERDRRYNQKVGIKYRNEWLLVIDPQGANKLLRDLGRLAE
jgi:hypothetical protein